MRSSATGRSPRRVEGDHAAHRVEQPVEDLAEVERAPAAAGDVEQQREPLLGGQPALLVAPASRPPFLAHTGSPA